MSQFPPPYPSGPYAPQYNYYQPAGDALAPAKRAGLLMIILAVLMFICGACCIGFGALFPRLMTEHPEAFANVKLPPEITPSTVCIAIISMGAVAFALAIAMLLLGVFVRRGGLGAAITSIVLTALILLGLLFNLVSVMLSGSAMGASELVSGFCMIVVPFGLHLLLLVLLIQAARAAPHVSAMQQQMQAQMWHYQQQAAAYGGYGAQAQQPAPPPSQSPPPPGDSNGPASQG